MTKKINIEAIRIDGGTQSRVEISNEAVADYAEAVRSGAEFPPVVVFHDGADYWLADGFHRFHAHKHAEKASIAADVRAGTQRDAVLFSLGANGTHGLRRTNADKRKAVQTVLADAEWAQWSDRKVAEVCGVTHPFVASLRRPPEVVTITTPRTAQGDNGYHPDPAKKAGAVESDSMAPAPAAAPAPAEKPAKRTLNNVPPEVGELTDADELAEARDTILQLAEENDLLRDKLAVENMDASETAKTEAADTIRDLRAQVKTLEAELEAVKGSRDTYMREATEAKKQAIYWRKKAEKAGAAA